MSFICKRKLPNSDELRQKYPFKEELIAAKAKRDNEIKDIFMGMDNRLILIIGPCSAHQEDAVSEYVRRLARVQQEVADKILIIPRLYTNKPRTTGLGYKGMLHQPDLNKDSDMVAGLEAIRHMHIRIFDESRLAAADEMLYPENYPYLSDLLSYVAIGARSVENQQHRLTVSGFDIPVGMKNPTSGDLGVMFDSILAAQSSHVFVYNGWEVETEGNNLTHAVLRGAVDKDGKYHPNYHYESLIKAAEIYRERGLVNPAIIVDTNHANSGKLFYEQPRIAREVMHSRKHSDSLKGVIKGLMIESYLLEGMQHANGNEFGKSITDPCLGWDASERLIYDLAEMSD
ncbi:MAG: 3-deoxy-7-phosphoheptulonate synthase [Spirochaetia bacterium]|jgi:3-deoxy-7-phosphoheptulonate synthase|nr:3-deoxy-7-phosphoheptulonate synthase [Spirochaetia bacterium]